MPLTNIALDTDGLAVGNNQLTVQANTVIINSTLLHTGELYSTGLAKNVTLSQEYNEADNQYNANGYITAFTEGTVRTSNVAYNASGNPTGWIETDFTNRAANVSYRYAVTYDLSGLITRLQRTQI
jgi:YD repeat-containing protein